MNEKFFDSHRALDQLEEIYLEALDFFKESQLEGFYEPAGIVEEQDHTLRSLVYHIPPGQESIPLEKALQSLHQQAVSELKQKKICSWVTFCHVHLDSETDYSLATEVETANAILITLGLDQEYRFLLPYQDDGNEIVYDEIISLDEEE